MSTLEAIAAGLPVIVTNAGGSPEVVGHDNVFAKIVPHSNSLAIGKAIESFVQEKKGFSDNLEYATKRLEKFNSIQQMNQLDQVIEKVTAKMNRVGIFTSMIQGGAGKAAMRVHKALLINGIQSTLLTRNDNIIIPKEPDYLFLKPEIGLTWNLLQSNNYKLPGNTIFSINEPNLTRATLTSLVADMDVINIQWVARFLSVEDIGFLSNLEKPLVITIRDMHPLTGGCHFFHGCEQWKLDCYGCPQLVGDKKHFPKKVLSLKKQYWNMKNITFVALSQHSVDIIKKSAIYDNNNIEVIANPIDLNVFSPVKKEDARQYFNIKENAPFIFYIPSYGSRVKGSHEFKEALSYIKEKYPDLSLTLIMAGSATALIDASEFSFPIIHLGCFTDDTLLAKAYSAADLTVIPSLEETFSNTAAESISCGTPIVGFNTGAIADIAGQGIRGESVPVGDIKAFGDAVFRVLKQNNYTHNCRSYAEENFSFSIQGEKYRDLFKRLKSLSKIKSTINPNKIPIVDHSIVEDTYCWLAKKSQIHSEQKQDKKKSQDKKSVILSLCDTFDEFCQISVLLHPKRKLQSYNKSLKNWNIVKKNENLYIWQENEYLEAIDNLCSINVKKEPIKKLKNYRKLLLIWHKLK